VVVGLQLGSMFELECTTLVLETGQPFTLPLCREIMLTLEITTSRKRLEEHEGRVVQQVNLTFDSMNPFLSFTRGFVAPSTYGDDRVEAQPSQRSKHPCNVPRYQSLSGRACNSSRDFVPPSSLQLLGP
jgi:hypothetical protein